MVIRCSFVACVVSALALAATPAFAERARLSADLVGHVNAGSQNIGVIVHGDKADVDALAARYNLRVKRYLRSGGVLSVTAGQLAAMRDGEQDGHFSGDSRIFAHALATENVTAETIGADLVWSSALPHHNQP